MANWDKISSRGNVSDRRAKRFAVGGGLGIVGIILTLGLTYLGGGDVLGTLFQLAGNGNISVNTEDVSQYEGNDEYEVFVSTVLGSNNSYWSSELSSYSEPSLVLFRGVTQSACGGAQSVVGPHYCPLDQTIYLDETFFNELRERFGAQGGDVAQAYVIGHEVGHHVQNLKGVLDKVSSQQGQINLELQADCYAGLWAGSLKGEGIYEKDEILEALDAAAAVGDDNVQNQTSGTINPESWTHGSSAERVKWFSTGYDATSPAVCDPLTT